MSQSGNGGEITYVISADDSSLESDLDNAESKIKKSAKQVEQTAEQSERNVSNVVKNGASKTARAHEQGNKDIENIYKESGEKRKNTEKQIGEAMTQMADSACEEIGVSFSGITDIVTSPIGASAAVGTAVAGISVKAVSLANDIDAALNQLKASTGATAKETEKYRVVMESVYKNNYGESFGDIGEAIAQVTKNLGDMDDASLQNITESAFALRDTFGYDIPESTRAAKAMMDNFGISADEAMNLIAAGAQDGLEYSDELMDSISEYSVQFAKVGLDADDMFKILKKGADSGAFNLDKVGDAVKELSIRAIDGSKSTAEGFELLGLNADEMSAKFAAGGDSAKEAFEQTIEALAKMEDPITQNTAGVDLFGTMWEDLGAEAVTALADIEDGAYATGEELDKLKEVKYDDLGSQFEGLKRNLEMLLVPLGEQLIPILTQIMEEVLPPLMTVLEPLIGIIGTLVPPLLSIIGDILGPLLELVSQLLSPLLELVENILTPLMEIIQGLVEPLMNLIMLCIQPLLDLVMSLLEPLVKLTSEGIGPLTEAVKNMFKPIADVLEGALKPLHEFMQILGEFILAIFIARLEFLQSVFSNVFDIIAGTVMDKINSVKSIFQNLIDFIQNVFSGNWSAAWQNICNIFSNVMELLPDSVQSIIGSISGILKNLIEFIGNVFSGNWSAAWQNVLDILRNIWSGIVGIFKAPLNVIIDGWNLLAKSLGSIDIPEWVPVVGGGSLSLPKLPRLKVGMDYVPSDFFPAFLDEGEAVLTKQENELYRELGGLQGMYSLSNLQDIQPVPDNIQEIDYDRMGKEMTRALNGMSVMLDKKPVGKIIAPVVNEELGRIEGRRT